MIHRFAASFIPAAIAALAITAAEPAFAEVIIADIQQDWSSTSNPNSGTYGTWSLNAGSTPLSYVTNWGADPSGFSGWGPAANAPGDFAPFWFKMTSAGVANGYDAPVGTVVVHPWDQFNGDRAGQANATWTDTGYTGRVTISGDVYAISSALPTRADDYQLILMHGTSQSVLASGTIPMNGSNSFSNPISFSIDSESISPGSVVMMQVTSDPTAPDGWFTAVDLKISADATSTPEPTSLAMLVGAASVAGIGAALRHKRRAGIRED